MLLNRLKKEENETKEVKGSYKSGTECALSKVLEVV
jgi:hypothetical protein